MTSLWLRDAAVVRFAGEGWLNRIGSFWDYSAAHFLCEDALDFAYACLGWEEAVRRFGIEHEEKPPCPPQ